MLNLNIDGKDVSVGKGNYGTGGSAETWNRCSDTLSRRTSEAFRGLQTVVLWKLLACQNLLLRVQLLQLRAWLSKPIVSDSTDYEKQRSNCSFPTTPTTVWSAAVPVIVHYRNWRICMEFVKIDLSGRSVTIAESIITRLS